MFTLEKHLKNAQMFYNLYKIHMFWNYLFLNFNIDPTRHEDTLHLMFTHSDDSLFEHEAFYCISASLHYEIN